MSDLAHMFDFSLFGRCFTLLIAFQQSIEFPTVNTEHSSRFGFVTVLSAEDFENVSSSNVIQPIAGGN
jgi:hypothetical protein